MDFLLLGLIDSKSSCFVNNVKDVCHPFRAWFLKKSNQGLCSRLEYVLPLWGRVLIVFSQIMMRINIVGECLSI
jgi:hypothetical protein